MRGGIHRALDRAAPWLFGVLALGAWEGAVRGLAIPPYVLPSPLLVARTLLADWGVLSASLLVTLGTTAKALGLALLVGVGLALAFARYPLLERLLWPGAVVLQVTPVVAVAPLLLIYLPQEAAVLACALIVAFFPVLANAVQGLRAADPNLSALFRLYGASGWQELWWLKARAALPLVLGGARIAGGLALVGAVVAEIAAGSAGAGSGLAYRVLESGYRLNVPRLFAALVLLCAAGLALNLALALASRALLRRFHDGG